MPDEPNPTPGDATTPTADPPKDQTQPTATPASPDPVKMAEEMGKLKAENENLKNYQQKVDPVIQTIWSDEELLKKTTEVYNKKLGVTPPTEEDTPIEPVIAPAPSAIEIENRNAHIKTIVDKFSTEHGIDKLDTEAQQGINTKIGVILQDMLDPKGNKTLPQIMDDVSLAKLPNFLENAYFLATKNETIEAARNQGKQEASTGNLGIIGSMPSQSPNPDSIGLTQKDRETAKNMGVSEEKYLEAKKQIASRGNQII